uniref:Peptidoglycan recognition protein 6 isoform B n=1 Tax=Ctenopharyngodon idella TaxID=7959 RepID=W5QK20_CTEID|nr:peptidoglycan recognition protein 6 isoform B [Ctenopharyngodon idella]
MAWHLGFLVSWLVVFSSGFTEATTTRRMDDFISAVERTEAENPGLQMLDVVKGLRKAAGFETNLIKHHLGDLSDARDLVTDPSVISYLSKVIKHSISQLGEEEGVVLTLDGSNVALAPMLLGLEAGLQSTIQGLYPLTLTENLVASFVHHAHTYGYNSRGYGVSFIGDYTSTLPVTSAMNMVRYDFTSCAVNGGRLSSSYSLYGHRQATSTDCPGNAFYRQIQTWERYQSYLP